MDLGISGRKAIVNGGSAGMGRGAVLALVGHIAQPQAHLGIGRIDVDGQPHRRQSRAQWHVEALAQVAVEPLDLALGLRPVGRAQPRHKPEVLGEVPQRGSEPVFALAVRVALAGAG